MEQEKNPVCSDVTGTKGTETVESLDYTKLLRCMQTWKRVTLSQTD